MWQLKELEGRIELGASTQSVNLMYGYLFIYFLFIYLDLIAGDFLYNCMDIIKMVHWF